MDNQLCIKTLIALSRNIFYFMHWLRI